MSTASRPLESDSTSDSNAAASAASTAAAGSTSVTVWTPFETGCSTSDLCFARYAGPAGDQAGPAP